MISENEQNQRNCNSNNNKKISNTYPSASLIIVEVHEPLRRVGVLVRIQKLPTEPLAVPDVLRASSPFPRPRLFVADAVIARAVRQFALRAGARHRKRYAGSRNRREIGRFPTS